MGENIWKKLISGILIFVLAVLGVLPTNVFGKKKMIPGKQSALDILIMAVLSIRKKMALTPDTAWI